MYSYYEQTESKVEMSSIIALSWRRRGAWLISVRLHSCKWGYREFQTESCTALFLTSLLSFLFGVDLDIGTFGGLTLVDGRKNSATDGTQLCRIYYSLMWFLNWRMRITCTLLIVARTLQSPACTTQLAAAGDLGRASRWVRCLSSNCGVVLWMMGASKYYLIRIMVELYFNQPFSKYFSSLALHFATFKCVLV